MTAKVRPLKTGDQSEIDTLLTLIQALADYEHLEPPDAAARARFVADVSGTPPRFWALLAEQKGRVVGYALFFETYSTFLALPTLYLEDLFVLPEARGSGIGRELFAACASEAARRGCGRMEWQALRWNDLALGFYDHLGAVPLHEDWTCYRLAGVELIRYGSSLA